MTDARRWGWSERSLLVATWDGGYRGAWCTMVERWSVDDEPEVASRPSGAMGSGKM